MAATLTLDTITSSGSTITVPTGKTMAITDAGALTIGGTAITTGAQGVISKTATYTILAGDFTGKSSLIVFVDVSGGTATDTIITLPTPASTSTCAIHVVSTGVHGLGNKITIKNSAAAEIYTLYHVGDHCEFVSDGTTTLRTGNEWVTVRGDVALTVNLGISASTTSDIWDLAGANYTEVEDIGGGWSTTTDDFTAPFAGEYMIGGSPSGTGTGGGFFIQSNGTWLNSVTSTGWNYALNQQVFKPFVLAKDDVITWWVREVAGGTVTLSGNASASSARATGDWWCNRRY
tara:strand:+ start:667 stop:1536 length:870 start_codon:yes stop_codon:yes gene_type:complete